MQNSFESIPNPYEGPSCDRCQGTGKKDGKTCTKCNGSGFVKDRG